MILKSTGIALSRVGQSGESVASKNSWAEYEAWYCHHDRLRIIVRYGLSRQNKTQKGDKKRK